jgi:putative two-component system response regulator
MNHTRILIADEDREGGAFLSNLLSCDGHRVRVVATAEETLAACATEPPDLVLLDLLTPHGQGFDICRQLKANPATRLTPVVIVTGLSQRNDRLAGIEAGADDFILKPFDSELVIARVRSLLTLKRYTDELESAEAIIVGLGATIEARDPTTQGHCLRLSTYATTFGRALGLADEQLEALHRGGFLHDIGKIAVPDRVLLKDGALDAVEERLMRAHPIIGDSLCAGLRSLRLVRPIVRHHHEHLDGTGYPDGLKSGAVPLLAQIVSIVDVFDALTTERPYRPALSRDEAYHTLRSEAQRGWRDPALVDVFIDLAQ